MSSDAHWQAIGFAELDTATLYQVMQLRQAVFVVEQNCSYQDLDGLDQLATHILCRDQGQLLAYQRCLPPGTSYPESSLGRVIVAPAARGRRLGRDLVQRGIDHNLQTWPASDIRIGAQAYLETFYASLGFVPEGDVYLEDGISHRHMRYHCARQPALPT